MANGEMKQTHACSVGKDGTQKSSGCVSTESVKTSESHGFIPNRVIPIIFLPGIMGSNLRIKSDDKGKERLARLVKQYKRDDRDTIAWCPDETTRALSFGPMSTAERQLTLDRDTVEVDSFDYDRDNINDAYAEREYVRRNSVTVNESSPHLRTHWVQGKVDGVVRNIMHTGARKACSRGWGEVMFSCYGPTLNRIETAMNAMFEVVVTKNKDGTQTIRTKLTPEWQGIVGVDPETFGGAAGGPEPKKKLPPVTEDDLRQIAENCWFPVHACGYNWIQSNGVSGKEMAVRIQKIIDHYNSRRLRCEKVIVVTHSCGGLVARALSHPKLGNFGDKILGVVYGEQPAAGAPAAYYRMLAGWENAGGVAAGIAGWALGNEGPEVHVMLANGPGGLELLPFGQYGNGWLQIWDREVDPKAPVRSLPERGDPYTEIYMKSGKDVWWGLLREEWINPAELKDRGLDETRRLLDDFVKPTHDAICNHYHRLSHAHYGVDPEQKSFRTVFWDLSGMGYSHPPYSAKQMDKFPITQDRGDKSIMLRNTTVEPKKDPKDPYRMQPTILLGHLRPPVDPGDGTVPALSAEDQRSHQNVRATFRLTGYDHQNSYKDKAAQNATLYSIVQIAKEMKWGGK